MRILFLSRWFPYPPDNGSKTRIYNILKQLSLRHEVSLLTFRESSDRVEEDNLAALRRISIDVRSIPYRPFRPSSLKALLSYLSPEPRYLVDTHSEAMAFAVREGVHEGDFGLVVASELGMAPYAQGLGELPVLLEDLELTAFMDAVGGGRALPQRTRSSLTWLKLAAYLRRTLPGFAGCTVVSELERERVGKVVPGYLPVRVIPNALDLSRFGASFGTPQPNTLVFSGALTYGANLDALHYFLREVYPLVLRAVPDVTLKVTGRTDGVDLASLPTHPGVRFIGYVDDIRPVVAQSWVSVVPLRMGGGTRLKILESMALGTPVVSTCKGAEGLDVADDENILVADEPVEFAARVVALLRSRELRDRLGEGGRRLVESRYDWQTVGRELSGFLEEVVASRGQRLLNKPLEARK